MPNTNTVFVTTLAVTLLVRISQSTENILHEYEISRSEAYYRDIVTKSFLPLIAFAQPFRGKKCFYPT